MNVTYSVNKVACNDIARHYVILDVIGVYQLRASPLQVTYYFTNIKVTFNSYFYSWQDKR